MRWILMASLSLAACSKGPEADLPSVGEARSLGAEWALINEQAAKGRLTGIYVQTMRKQLRDQLESDLKSLKEPQSRYAGEIRALLTAPDDASPESLRVHVAALKQQEDDLESA